MLIAINPNKQIEAAREAKRKSDQNAIAKAIQQYIIEKGVYPPKLQEVGVGGTVGLCVVAGCSDGIDLSSALSDYISSIPIPDRGQYLVTKTANGVSTGYDNSNIWATAAGGATVSPSLDLNFARDKSLIDSVSGNNPITFTRASTATYTGSDGLIKTAAINEPRFTHDPITKASQGLLIEEQRTNLAIRSTFQFPSTTAYPTGWVDFNPGRVVQSVSAAPDRTDAAIVGKVYGNSGGFRPSSAISLSTSTNYTVTWYARKPTDNELALFLSYYPTNLATGQAYVKGSYMRYDNTVAGLGNSSIVTLTDDWSRFSFSFNSSTSTQIQPNFTTMTQSGSYAPNDLFVIAGVQLEQGTFPTSYIPTTTAAATRNADVASITGTNFSSWYQQDEGTFFVDFNGTSIASGQFPRIIELNDGTSSNLIRLQQYAANVVRASVSTNGAGQFAADNGSVAVGIRGKVALGSAFNDAALVTNGASPTVDTAYLTPVGLTQLGIGASPGGSTSVLNSTIRRLTYWKTRLSNTVLQSITQ